MVAPRASMMAIRHLYSGGLSCLGCWIYPGLPHRFCVMAGPTCAGARER